MSMIHLLILAVHLLATIAKLLRPGGVRSVMAESLLLRHQLIISSRARRRAPNLSRGRDASYLAPPAQIRTCSFPAYGSYLGCVTAKRSLGQGWRMIGFGRKSSANFVIRSHVIRSFWLRRRSVRRQRSVT